MLRRTLSIPRLAVCALACMLVAAGAVVAAPSFPPLSGRVVDEAAILSPQTQSRLGALLAQEEKQTTDQIVVVTLKSLQGYSIEQYGYQLGRHWGIGQKGTNNGALLIVVPSAHAVRIEVGYGLEGQLTDAQTKIIIDEFMLPAFRRGDYNAGVLAGTEAVLRVLGGVTLAPAEPAQPQESQPQSGGGWMFIIVILVWLVFGRFLWPLFFLGALGGRGGFAGGFGGGFGGGGFSGGGGSFGGGGATGQW